MRVWVMTGDMKDLQSIVETDQRQNGFGPDFDNKKAFTHGLARVQLRAGWRHTSPVWF